MRSYGWIFLEESLPEAKPITGFLLQGQPTFYSSTRTRMVSKKSTRLQALAYKHSLTSTRLQAHACNAHLELVFFDHVIQPSCMFF